MDTRPPKIPREGSAIPEDTLLTNLYEDVLVNLFTFLDIHDLCRAKRSSRSVNKRCLSAMSITKVAHITRESQLRLISKYCQKLETIIINSRLKPTQSDLSRYTRSWRSVFQTNGIQNLFLGGRAGNKMQHTLLTWGVKGLRKIIGVPHPWVNFRLCCDSWQTLTTLAIRLDKNRKDTFQNTLKKLPNLETLLVDGDPMNVEELKLLQKCTKLARLSLPVQSEAIIGDRLESLKLTSLCLDGTFTKLPPVPAGLEQLSIKRSSELIKLDVGDILNTQKHLTHLYIAHACVFGFESFNRSAIVYPKLKELGVPRVPLGLIASNIQKVLPNLQKLQVAAPHVHPVFGDARKLFMDVASLHDLDIRYLAFGAHPSWSVFSCLTKNEEKQLLRGVWPNFVENQKLCPLSWDEVVRLP